MKGSRNLLVVPAPVDLLFELDGLQVERLGVGEVPHVVGAAFAGPTQGSAREVGGRLTDERMQGPGVVTGGEAGEETVISQHLHSAGLVAEPLKHVERDRTLQAGAFSQQTGDRRGQAREEGLEHEIGLDLLG